jgi:SAM-dependent methyltransferase
MSKLLEYIERYKKLHDGSDPYYQYDEDKDEWYLKPPSEDRNKRHEMFSGVQFIRKFPKHFKRFIGKKGSSITLLDYGCGLGQWTWRGYGDYPRGFLGHFGESIQSIWLYDPAVKQFSKKPPTDYRFDVVSCADVMEHVPEEHVDEVIAEIAMYCKDDGCLMFAISGNIAYKQFSDGENVHCTVKPIEWWEEKIKSTGREYVIIHSDNSREVSQETVIGNVK